LDSISLLHLVHRVVGVIVSAQPAWSVASLLGDQGVNIGYSTTIIIRQVIPKYQQIMQK